MFKNCSSKNNPEGKKNQNLELLSLLLFSIAQNIVASAAGKKRNERHAYWKGRYILSLFTDDSVLYGGNHKHSTRKIW